MVSSDIVLTLRVTGLPDAAGLPGRPLGAQVEISSWALLHVIEDVPVQDPILAALLGRNAAQTQEANVLALRTAVAALIKRSLDGVVHEIAWSAAKEIIRDDHRR